MGFSNDVVKRILFYLYSGIEPDVDNWGKEMLLFAQKYQLEDLTMSLGSKLISTLNDDNCIEYMKLGDLVHVKELIMKIWIAISKRKIGRKILSNCPLP